MPSGSGASSSNSYAITDLFKRKEIIGRGKFGVVYKAYHVKTKQVYAIKVLNLDNPEDEVEDIQKEIQFLSSLKQTPNITHYYGSYLNDTKLWVIMEHCAGGSLRTLLRPGIIDERYIGVIMREILVALMSIHRDNVIHRDIKAANVLIANNGSVKLCDFGVAAQLSQGMLKRQTMAGTPYWMAPEVIMEGVYYDTKVDIWSLGITAYEIATGNPPYCHMEALRAMQMITKSKPPRLEGKEYSVPLKEFIALCLDEDPKQRPTAEDLFKSKLIKQEKGANTVILRELITRFLLFREKNKQSKLDEDPNLPLKQTENLSLDGSDSSSKALVDDEDQNLIDVKWDFDSLSSKEYILENDINMDAIPEETDWSRYSQQEVNYAYPDEEYYHSNKPSFPIYNESTMGKTFGNPTVSFSTIQGNNLPTNQINSHFTKHYQHTGITTGKNLSRNTTTTTHVTTSKRSETKASKELLKLFEETDEENFEFPKLHKTLSSFSIQASIPLHGEKDAESRPDVRSMQSQSTPALSMMQTSFKSGVSGSTGASVLPTPIEIEIPEELPITKEPVLQINTKPRSSTVSSMTHKTTPVLQRRPTISGQPSAQMTSLRPDGNNIFNNNKTSANSEEIGSGFTFPAPGSTLMSTNKITNGSSTHPRSPSPPKACFSISPEKKVIEQSQQSAPSHTNAPPTMKQLNVSNDILLQSMNAPSEKDGNQESSRINRDFKKNHPNLKLQMPSPTTLLNSNKLLDASQSSLTIDEPQQQQQQQQTVNQFGINTSNAQIPIAMTPVGEKRIGDLAKPRKRSTSTSRNNSVSTDHPSNAVANPSNSSIPSSTANTSSISVAPTTISRLIMDPPSKALSMDMFLDVHDDHRVDNKPVVLAELEALLKTFEDGLSVMEQSLRNSLPQESPEEQS